MPSIEFTWDSQAVAAFSGPGVRNALLSALKKAGADGVRAARAESKRRVREGTRIRAGYLADRALPIEYARGSRLEELEWKLSVSGRAVPLGEYPRRQVRRGVSIEVRRGDRKILASAFLAKSRAGRHGVYLRPGKGRYPMGHRLGMSVADAMADGRVPNAALYRARYVMTSAFGRLLHLELGRRSR